MSIAAAVAAPAVKPLMRGWSHLLAFCFALGGTAALVPRVPAGPPTWAALVYGGSLCTLFGTSALYHCPYWSMAARRRLRPLDHSAIFVLIAGTFTPFALALAPSHRLTLLTVGWGLAALGVLRAVFWSSAPKPLIAALSVFTGWSVVPFVPELYRALGPSTLGIVGLGGVLYTVGAVIFALRRPNPWPRVFGFHEIFHLLVIAAAACDFAAVQRVLAS